MNSGGLSQHQGLSLHVLQTPCSCANTYLIRESHLSCWEMGEMWRPVAGTQDPAPNPVLIRAIY